MNEPDITIEDKSEETEKTEGASGLPCSDGLEETEKTEGASGLPCSDGLEVQSLGEEKEKEETTLDELTASVKELAAKIPDSISKAVERALSGRDFPLMVKVNDEALKRIDQLVESGIFKNRSESAAFLISEGIKAQATLFERIESKIEEIEQLREELKNIIHGEIAGQ